MRKEGEERQGVRAVTGRVPNSLNKQENMDSMISLAGKCPEEAYTERFLGVWGLGQGLLETGTGNLMNK